MNASKKKHPGGRPSKYKPEYCQKLIEHMKQGYSYETFAASTDVDVNVDTLYQWEKVHKEFSEAKKKAFLLCQKWWEQQGMDGLFVPKHTAFSAAVWIFNMKCRFKWRDGDEKTKDTPDVSKQQKLKVTVKYSDGEIDAGGTESQSKDSATEENK